MDKYIVYVWQSNDDGVAFCYEVYRGNVADTQHMQGSSVNSPSKLCVEIGFIHTLFNEDLVTYKNFPAPEIATLEDEPLEQRYLRLLETVVDIAFERQEN